MAGQKSDWLYKFTDRSLYGARAPFIKIFAKEEKLDGMSEEELAKRVSGMGMDNITDCNCFAFETEMTCEGSPLGCIWRPLFESCHPPEMIDGGTPICPQTESPTFSPTISIDETIEDTETPTLSPSVAPLDTDPWYTSLFKSSEHETSSRRAKSNSEDDDAVSRKLSVVEEYDEYPFDELPTDLLDPNQKDGSKINHDQKVSGQLEDSLDSDQSKISLQLNGSSNEGISPYLSMEMKSIPLMSKDNPI